MTPTLLVSLVLLGQMPSTQGGQRQAALTDEVQVVFSTYLGGSLDDIGNAVAVDAAGNLYIAGFTASADLPSSQAAQGTFRGGLYDAFVAKLDPTGRTVLYATFFGGSGDDMVGWRSCW